MTFLDTIKRPTLLIDEKRCRTNIRTMAEKARKSGVIFRPHFKSHQSATMGEWYREEGVKAITVSSVGMAMYFADAGWKDITIAFPVNLREMDKMNHLAGKIKLNLLVNSLHTCHLLVKHLRHNVGIFIEIDTGYGRSGLTSDQIKAIEAIIGVCDQSKNLRFEGYLSHFGESYQAKNPKDTEQVYQHGMSELQQIRDSLHEKAKGMISVGDTPCCSVMDSFPGADEIRPGNFLFYDVMQMEIGTCKADQISLCLAAPVVDLYPDRNEAIVYAGAIHLSKENIHANGKEIYGLIVQLFDQGWSDPLEGCFVSGLSQEHGVIHLDTGTLESIKPGSLLGILPIHACLTADSMKQYLTLQGKTIRMFNGF